jgi:hypothetical protein
VGITTLVSAIAPANANPLPQPLPVHSRYDEMKWNGSPTMIQDSDPNSPSTSRDELRLWETAAKALGRSDRSSLLFLERTSNAYVH